MTADALKPGRNAFTNPFHDMRADNMPYEVWALGRNQFHVLQKDGNAWYGILKTDANPKGKKQYVFGELWEEKGYLMNINIFGTIKMGKKYCHVPWGVFAPPKGSDDPVGFGTP